MERMITDRLAFYMESRGILSPHQSGFRRGRGTMDPVSTNEDNILTRLSGGHTRLNKMMHLINKHPSGFCKHCQMEKLVEHVILHRQK